MKGAIEEAVLDFALGDGEPLHAMVSAVTRLEGGVATTQIALMRAQSRRRYERDLREKQAVSATLHINAFPTAAREIFSWLVLPFLQEHPQVHIDIVTEGRMVDIVAGGFDFGVRGADHVPVDMIALPMGRARRNVVVARPAI